MRFELSVNFKEPNIKCTIMNKYSDETSWQKFYILTEHWQSDLQFYKDDLRFLHHLVDKYLIWITKKENLDLVNDLKNKLFEIRKKCTTLIEKITKHRNKIAQLLQDPVGYNAQAQLGVHGMLEKEFADFIKAFRDNRKEVFKITEYVIDSESLPNILSS